MISISFVIPVYNRPDEIVELLQSIEQQGATDYDIIVVEDGSSQPCREAIAPYAERMPISYYYKDNSGPGQSRNYGAERATGDYIIVLDSDALLPKGYIDTVRRHLEAEPIDAFGGPDKAAPGFTPTQKAINYSMTSFLTTGGIRGGKKRIDKFYPRSFNMGVRRSVWNELGGFADMRYGEDIDFSTRLYAAGKRVVLLDDAWVWHKRRNTIPSFFRQVRNFGRARICLTQKYPDTLKLVHLFPALFTVGSALLVLLAPFTRAWSLAPLALLLIVIFFDSLRLNHHLGVAALSMVTTVVQQCGYGSGFLAEGLKVLKARRAAKQ